MGKRELVALLNLSSWCLVMVEQLFLAMPWVCLLFVIVVFPDHIHYFSWLLLVFCDPSSCCHGLVCSVIMVFPDHTHLFSRPHIPNATYKFPRSSAFWKVFYDCFSKYDCGGHFGYVIRASLNKCSFPHPKESPYEVLSSIGQ